MHDRLESERTPLARKARIIASAVYLLKVIRIGRK